MADRISDDWLVAVLAAIPENGSLVTDLAADLFAARKRIAELYEALSDCLGWHNYANDPHKPIEVRAAYMRAEATLAELEAEKASEEERWRRRDAIIGDVE